MLMQDLDLLFRVSGAVVLLLMGALLLRDGWRTLSGVLFAAFALGASAYLIGNAAEPGFIVPDHLAGARQLLSGNLAFVYWWFSRSLFEDDFRLGRWEWTIAGLWVSLFAASQFLTHVPINLAWGLVAFGVGLVGHVSWLILRGREDDLVAARRQARLIFAILPSGFFGLDLAIDILFGFSWKPLELTFWQNAAFLFMILVMANWLLRMDVTVIAPKPQPKTVPEITTNDNKLAEQLVAYMQTHKPHLNPDMTFAAFAQQIGIAQPRLRALINRELGYRHFRNFLNAWRVQEAKKMLADPARASDKILAIAFDAGFASLASFNRAFLAHQAQSPSVYRAQLLRAHNR